MKNILYLIIFILTFLSINYSQNDSLRSQAFKDTQFKRTYFKAKYPSYSLLAGYILVKEANRGDPFAQHELGIRYLLGQGFPSDTVKAIYWIRRAVDQNLPAAKYNYGILLYNGIGVPWNPFEAYVHFKSASNAGLPEAQFAYGLLLTDNLVVSRNYGEAYKLFQSSAKSGYQPAKDALEQFKKSGFIPPNDSSQTNNSIVKYDDTAVLINQDWDLDFYDFDTVKKKDETNFEVNKILNKSSNELKKYFGLSAYDENDNINLPDTSGKGILTFAADNDSPEALLLIARAYERGILFEKNLIAAASNYLRAYRLGSYKAGEYLFKLIQNENFINSLKEKANKNDADAMYVTAGITALGFTNQISNQQALELLKNAVAKKHIPSIIELGLCYGSGTLVKKDISKAVEYWELAKNLGSKEALVRIAFTQIADSTKRTNLNSLIEILRNAANKGSVLAETYLGFCYEKGIGVKEEKGTAVKFYRHAAQRGNQAAFNSLKRMYDEIRPNDEEFQILETE